MCNYILKVFLVEQLSSTVERQETMIHLTAVLFIRPTSENISLLCRELSAPKFKEYHIFFSNVVSATHMIQTIADADDYGLVRQIQEYYADVIPIDSTLFSLNSQRLLTSTVGRSASAVLSVFLSLKMRPKEIRFTLCSPSTRALASEIAGRLASDDIHDFPLNDNSPVLIILDRKSDPVTPLLSQWTYQAMVHELLGLNNGRVMLPDVPDGEVTMSGRDDAFFEENKYQNFGIYVIFLFFDIYM
jgi:vacuolar protein sorting-associated protein 45